MSKIHLCDLCGEQYSKKDSSVGLSDSHFMLFDPPPAAVQEGEVSRRWSLTVHWTVSGNNSRAIDCCEKCLAFIMDVGVPRREGEVAIRAKPAPGGHWE